MRKAQFGLDAVGGKKHLVEMFELQAKSERGIGGQIGGARKLHPQKSIEPAIRAAQTRGLGIEPQPLGPAPEIAVQPIGAEREALLRGDLGPRADPAQRGLDQIGPYIYGGGVRARLFDQADRGKDAGFAQPVGHPGQRFGVKPRAFGQARDARDTVRAHPVLALRDQRAELVHRAGGQ